MLQYNNVYHWTKMQTRGGTEKAVLLSMRHDTAADDMMAAACMLGQVYVQQRQAGTLAAC
jgi:hypothetical protein